MSTIYCPPTLVTLPSEIIHLILLYLDTAELLQTSRTCWSLRSLALDPLLHHARRQSATYTLSHALAQRPPRINLCPPQAWIWLSRTNVLSRSISKSLIKIRLSHNLEKRPSVEELVERAILPAPCAAVVRGGVVVSPVILQRGEDVRKNRLKDRLGRKLERRPSMRELVGWNIIPEECAGSKSGRGRMVSPRLVEARRRIMKEALKNALRNWVERRALLEQKRREGEEKLGVKALVRRMTVRGMVEDGLDGGRGSVRGSGSGNMVSRKRREGKRWERDVRGDGCSQPTRAHVLGLRRFWEGVTKSAAG